MRFAERLGYTPIKTELAEDELPDSLLAGLWDCLYMKFFTEIGRYDHIGRLEGYNHRFYETACTIWFSYFRKPIDSLPRDPKEAVRQVRDYFFGGPFYLTYDFLEFMCNAPMVDEYAGQIIAETCNEIFERELAQFRFASTTLVKITNNEELAAIQETLTQHESSSVGEHLKRAAQLYSQRPSPDYRNSIKESISAVEAAVSYAVDKKSFGVAKPLRLLGEEFDLHPALRDGFEKIYAFTSDEGGVRHALMEKANVRQEDARFMLTACSAFSNYLIALKARG